MSSPSAGHWMMVIHPRTSKYVSAAFTSMESFLTSLICNVATREAWPSQDVRTVSDFVMVLSILATCWSSVSWKATDTVELLLSSIIRAIGFQEKYSMPFRMWIPFPRLGAFVANSHQRSAVRQLAYAANRTSDLPMPFYNTYKSLRQGQSSAA